LRPLSWCIAFNHRCCRRRPLRGPR
jgi:hypothetical protein